LFYKGYTWLNAATKRKKKLSVIRRMHGSFARKRIQVALVDDAQMAAVGMTLRAIKRALLGLVKALPTKIKKDTNNAFLPEAGAVSGSFRVERLV
jgi:hypothetical protein